MTLAASEIRALFDNTRATLLALRGDHGHWEGELSSSALSTATAVMALEMFLEAQPNIGNADGLRSLVEGGIRWLAEGQNADGGWGDTNLSKSNISTTALVWAAFSGRDQEYAEVVSRCEIWLSEAAGDLAPRNLARAIADRYGRDRTFSVPILTTLALRKRLGPTDAAWRLVPQLPFELAAFPRGWYAALKMPVVSYALPALIAIGQAKHQLAPTWNPLARLVRNGTRGTTLKVLESIQPESGGFLEATPLTSFVVMSLAGAGNARHPVARQGIGFLVDSVRADGSWPIDTNLATWVTTLSVNALAEGPADSQLTDAEGRRITDWLLAQQYKVVHPYTNAAPGAWAWTDLTGGVPDADDTPGTLLALWKLAGSAAAPSAQAGVTWLLDLQNGDGGIPTFCKGWGVLPFDRSSADLTAHTLRAWSTWNDAMPPRIQARIRRGTARGLKFLERSQRPDGLWAPLWFGNQHAASEENLVYGTSRVLLALAEANEEVRQTHSSRIQSAAEALAAIQNDDGGWGGEHGTPSSIEETALAIEALSGVMQQRIASSKLALENVPDAARFVDAIQRGLKWLVDHTDCGRQFPPSPIGFYFAKLWYYERLYPIVYTLTATSRALKILPP